MLQTDGNCTIRNVLGYRYSERDQAWRFITYMFVHGSINHILFNVLIQLFLGIALEVVHSWWRVTLVYLSGVLAGSMGYSVFHDDRGLIGASGGVYAIIVAHVATIILNWEEMKYGKLQLFVFLILCSANISTDYYQYKIIPNIKTPRSGIGHTAHICGAVSGLLVGLGVLRNLNVRPYQKKIWWCAVSVYMLLMIAAVFYNIFVKKSV